MCFDLQSYLLSDTYRLSTVRHADSIIVMEGGVVVETGSHDELLQRKGVYYSLVHAQVVLHLAPCMLI